ncbi:MAG: enoyl-CoA hydratase/isomerase family protein [Pseudomonadales bacterium]|nr:enoyl-CoA hydratase/isomerase family protein [Pseudomonadales bacterium]
MPYANIEVTKDGHIAWLHFNRPDKANALNYDHLAEIEDAALSFRDDAETRVVVFTGNGKHFSSGADLTDAGEAYKVPLVQRRRRMRMGERTIEAILEMDQITIAAWNGAAMGGGACITTACDFRVGADDCFMQYPEVDIGLNLMWKSLPLIVTLAGPAKAKRLVVGGERIHATELERWGILDRLCPLSELHSEAQDMANHYAAKPPIAAQMIKQSTNQITNALNHAIMHMDVDQNMWGSTTEDRALAVKSYLDKSKATFTGN